MGVGSFVEKASSPCSKFGRKGTHKEATCLRTVLSIELAKDKQRGLDKPAKENEREKHTASG